MFISSKILGYEEAVFGDQGGRDYFALLPKQLQNLIKNKTIQNSKQLFSDIEKWKRDRCNSSSFGNGKIFGARRRG